MKMEGTGIINDSLQLLKIIVNNSIPGEKYTIVNIAKSSMLAFTDKTRTKIPTSFGFSFDKVPEYLKTQNIFIEEWIGRWFLGKVKGTRQSWVGEKITDKARELGYFDSNTIASYFLESVSFSDKVDFGMDLPLQRAVLVDIEKAKEFIAWNEGSTPLFYESNKTLYYRGKQLTFQGLVESRFIDILVKNSNSIVPKKDIYEYVYPEGKEYSKNKSFADDSLKSTFKRLKVKIAEDKFFDESFALVEKKGFGILTIEPLKREDKTPKAQ